MRGLTGLADDSSVVTVVAGASLEPEDLLERCRPCVIDAVRELVGHPVLPALADGLICEKALGRFAIICLEVPEDARAGQRTSLTDVGARTRSRAPVVRGGVASRP